MQNPGGDTRRDEEYSRLAQQYGIRLIVQFGSTTTGREHPASDVDLGILLSDDEISFRQIGELTSALQAQFLTATWTSR